MKYGGVVKLSTAPSPGGTAIHCCFVFVELGWRGRGRLSHEHFDSLSNGFFRLHRLKHMAALVHGLKSDFLAEFLCFYLFVTLVG